MLVMRLMRDCGRTWNGMLWRYGLARGEVMACRRLGEEKVTGSLCSGCGGDVSVRGAGRVKKVQNV